MSDLFQQKCPLCNNNSSFESKDFNRRKLFNCSHCGVYQVTNEAEIRITSMPNSQLLEAAQATLSDKVKGYQHSNILDISINTPSNKQVGIGYPTFIFDEITNPLLKNNPFN